MTTDYEKYDLIAKKLEDKYFHFLKLNYGFEIGMGWFPIIENFLEKAHHYQDDIQIVQIKEKFGGLRIYASYLTPDDDDDYMPNEHAYHMVNNLIEEAMFKASVTCCSCGTDQNVTKKFAYCPYCENCYNEVKPKSR